MSYAHLMVDDDARRILGELTDPIARLTFAKITGVWPEDDVVGDVDPDVLASIADVEDDAVPFDGSDEDEGDL